MPRVFLAVLGICYFLPFSYAAESAAETYYTKVNIWYEDPAKIVSTNYHRGAIIPYGSKVAIVSRSGEKILFSVDDQPGITFVLTNIRKYSLMDTAGLFQQYFAQEDPKAQGKEFGKFNSREKDNIENGTVEAGMSKEAVIAAYGYPPKHKTPALTSNIWTYWDARSVRRVLTFKDNRVTNSEEVNEYREGRPRWYHFVP